MSAWTRHIRGRDSSISLRIAHVIKIIIATRMENTGMAHSRSKGFLAACPIGSATGTIATFLSPSSITNAHPTHPIYGVFYQWRLFLHFSALYSQLKKYALQHTERHTALLRMFFRMCIISYYLKCYLLNLKKWKKVALSGTFSHLFVFQMKNVKNVTYNSY